MLRVVYDLQQYGRVRGRAYLGVTLQNLDASVAEIYGLPLRTAGRDCDGRQLLGKGRLAAALISFWNLTAARSTRIPILSPHFPSTGGGRSRRGGALPRGRERGAPLTLDERPGEEEINEAEQQAQNELEGQSGQEEEFTVPDFDGYGYDYGG